MKRLIFTLLYKDGYFVLSRNFRHQVVGKLSWVLKNYNLEEITNYIDELIIINISKNKNLSEFCKIVDEVSKKTFIPIVVGGGIEDLEQVKILLKHGADKILINSLFHNNPNKCAEISEKYGRQFVVAAIDYSYDRKYKIYNPSKKIFLNLEIKKHIQNVINNGAGEILFQSIDRDGTGNGLDYKILNLIKKLPTPIILMGGVGNYSHIVKGYNLKYCDAVSTANLFNFVANEFKIVRNKLQKKYIMPKKTTQKIQSLKKFKR
jgi:cyclase